MPQQKTNNKGLIQRVPRPKGYTIAITTIHNTINKEKKLRQLERIKELTIEQWTLNSYQVNNETYSISKMAEYLGMGIEVVMQVMNKVLLKVANIFDNQEDTNQRGQFARAQIFRSIFLSLENEALSKAQAELLIREQDGHYKPFLTSEVNRALGNLTQAQKPILDLLKLITDKDPTLLTGKLPENQNESVKYISTEQAIKLVRDNSASVIDNPQDTAAYLDFTDLPNVDARTQDLTSIGIKTLKSLENRKDSKSKGTFKDARKKEANQFSHGNRDKEGHIIEIDEDEYSG